MLCSPSSDVCRIGKRCCESCVVVDSRNREEKRKETKQRRERERKRRADAWRERKRREIVYLGEGVSAGLSRVELDRARLDAHGLPHIGSAEAIAEAMDIDVGELRFMAFTRKVSRINHYRRFTIPKKTGGERLISAPMPRLKETQHWILNQILEKVPVHEAAHGFRAGHSIVTGARPHVGADVVVNVDLEDFFPTVTYKRVKGLFRSLGYSEQAATIFGLVCTEPEVDEIEIDGQTWWITHGPRFLPQGAPTSPAITNLLCRRLDRRLAGLAEKLGWEYTRYADDLSFSGRGEDTGRQIYQVLRKTREIVEHEGFRVQEKKTRVMRRGRRQEVTGLVVNDKPAIERKTLRRFRALLYQIEKDGVEGKQWAGYHGTDAKFLESVQGFAAYVEMVDPEKGRPLVERVTAIIDPKRDDMPQHKRWPKKEPSWTRKKPPEPPEEQEASAPEAQEKRRVEPTKKKPWWKFW